MEQLPFGMTTIGFGLALWFGFWYVVYLIWEKITKKNKYIYEIDPTSRRLRFTFLASIISLPIFGLLIMSIDQLPFPLDNNIN